MIDNLSLNLNLNLNLNPSDRIVSLRNKTMSGDRYLSIEQAKIITRVYQQNEDLPVALKRAIALAQSLSEIPIAIDPEEFIVGNRTPDNRAGVMFPEAGLRWLLTEIESLPRRPQDPFKVRPEDAEYFKEIIEPFWRGKTLEDDIYNQYGEELSAIEKVVKINQKDHAQGHICPKVEDWLRYGPSGLLRNATEKLSTAADNQKAFYKSVCITLGAACRFIDRYAVLAIEMSEQSDNNSFGDNMKEISVICKNLSENPPATFHEALQSVWFLFVILHMESNASSFSPGRMDQYLYPFYKNDLKAGRITEKKALELLDGLFIKFNQIVYLRNEHSARYFAGFPIGFNITVGGKKKNGDDATNELSFLILKTQDHIRLPQPNLTARLHRNSPAEFINECSRVIGLGNGMPQIVNDENIIPALRTIGLEQDDCNDYALVGCVELSTQGNYLGWSDAAMFNMVKALELTLNDGICMLTGKQIGPQTGSLDGFNDYAALENAFRVQIDFFIDRMIKACDVVEKCHQVHLPSPFLSSVVDDCLMNGIDVTAGGAKYNLSGIQAIQVANIADSLAVLKKLVFDDKRIGKKSMTDALRNNFDGDEPMRQLCINRVPKYGNDTDWVDNIGAEWVTYFAGRLKQFRNFRGGIYHMGLYTVSAHVPMGQNVGASADGRLARTPLADGGMSPMYGRDKSGPTAVLNSVSRIPSYLATNGSLLNMKFLPSLFENDSDREKFSSLLRSFVSLPINHVQFNVVTSKELISAKADPESYRGLTIRVAGYTAYFTELSEDLQDEIIKRTTHGENI
jgi:pyruvate formate-lyase/glycerol dehydratase family glycyl radical enzyme